MSTKPLKTRVILDITHQAYDETTEESLTHVQFTMKKNQIHLYDLGKLLVEYGKKMMEQNKRG